MHTDDIQGKKNYYGYALELPQNDSRHRSFRQQRESRGFDDTELWNLDYSIVKFILARLKYARDWDVYPSLSIEYKENDGSIDWVKSKEGSRKILDEIIVGLESYIKLDKKDLDQFNKSLELLMKHFSKLWC